MYADLAKWLEARTLSYKAYRCFFLADAYRRASKYSEAYALFARAADHTTRALKAQSPVDAMGQSCPKELCGFQREVAKLQSLSSAVAARQLLVHASAVFECEERPEEIEEKLELVCVILFCCCVGFTRLFVAQGVKRLKPRTMLERLDMYDAGSATDNFNLISFPPNFEATPCKPILFDLAFNSLAFPDISKVSLFCFLSYTHSSFRFSALKKRKRASRRSPPRCQQKEKEPEQAQRMRSNKRVSFAVCGVDRS
jgi:signal recognition particle subunit SRP68